MTAVLGVQFHPHGTLHLLGLGAGQHFRTGDLVLFPTEGGRSVATVVWTGQVDAAPNLPACQGAATAADLAQADADRQRRAEIEVVAGELIARHGLPMKVLAVDHQLTDPDQSLAVIYYQAPGRVDFRALLVDLSRVLQCRLDLRQIGDRDAARLVCDVGSCGRPSCCTTYLQVLEPVSANAGRSPQQALLGMCDRTACCLQYERGCGARG